MAETTPVFDDNGVAVLPSGAKIVAPHMASTTPQQRQEAAAAKFDAWLASNPTQDQMPVEEP